MSTLNQKVSISIASAALFTLVNAPFTFKLVDSITPFNVYNASSMCPTNTGLIVHALVFFMITYYSMKGSYASKGTKIKHSLYGSLIFFFLASPAMYALTRSIFGSWVASSAGCPTLGGVLLHAVVYCAALVAVMYLP